MAQIAIRLKALHQLFKWDVLVLIGSYRGLAHAFEQVEKRGIIVKIRAYDQSINEATDKRLQIALSTPRDRDADRNTRLIRVAI